MSYLRQSGIFRSEADPFRRKTVVTFMMHKVLLLLKFLQTKPQIRSKSSMFYDVYYTMFLKLSDGENSSDFIQIISSILY